jgi:hypothetical protein
MKSFHQILTEKTNFVTYHNVEKKVADGIRATGFKLQKKITRARLYGNGVYFTDKPNTRWGPVSIKVELRPKNPLLDPSGDISYEGNELGDKIEAIGKSLMKDFSMSNSKQRAVAIEKYLNDNKIDMLQTDEMGKMIYVVRNPKIIKIVI